VPSETWYVKNRLNWAFCDAFLYEEWRDHHHQRPPPLPVCVSPTLLTYLLTPQLAALSALIPPIKVAVATTGAQEPTSTRMHTSSRVRVPTRLLITHYTLPLLPLPLPLLSLVLLLVPSTLDLALHLHPARSRPCSDRKHSW